MNTPNKLTLLRVILVVPFLVMMSLYAYEFFKNQQHADFNNFNNATIYFITAGSIFTMAMITDFLDGYLARKNKQITTFGKLFDPLADKFMTTGALIMFSFVGIVPIWVTIIFILRDILVDGSRNLAAKNNVNVAASFWGKSKTMLQSIGIVALFFIYPADDFGTDFMTWEMSAKLWALNVPVIISSVLSIISGAIYFKAIIPYINAK